MSKQQFDEFVRNARTITVKADETTIVLREELGFDSLYRPHLNRIISDMLMELRRVKDRDDLPDSDWANLSAYVDTISQTVSSKGKYHSLPGVNASNSDLVDGFWLFLTWSKPLMGAVRKGLRDVAQIEPSPKAKKSE